LVIGSVELLQKVTGNNYDCPKIAVNTVHTKSSQFATFSTVVPTMSSASVLTFLLAGDCLTANSLVKVMLRPMVSRPISLGVKTFNTIGQLRVC
jgi:hypothetical protein